ncbi:quinone oxidoreductase family protein [Corynebacterium sp. 335C]
MRGIRVSRFGGADVLEHVGDLPDPRPGAGEVLVRVEAAGINYTDVYQREGIYPRDLPFIPGGEGAGVVEEVGEGVDGVSPGDRVAWCDDDASYAEFTVLPAGRVVPVPDGVSPETAASAMLQGCTAHFLATSVARLGEGDTCLITAGAGGVGLLLTQYARALGATPITLTSTEEKAELSRAAGAAHVLRYGDDVPDEVRDLTGGRGADVVFDGVGRATFAGSLASARVRGLVVLFGAASGAVEPFDPQELNKHGSLMLTRPHLRHFIASDEELRERAGDVLERIARGELDVRTGATYPLADARRAHEDLEARRTTGASVLLP